MKRTGMPYANNIHCFECLFDYNAMVKSQQTQLISVFLQTHLSGDQFGSLRLQWSRWSNARNVHQLIVFRCKYLG